MEPGRAKDRRSFKSGSYAFAGATWTTTSRLPRIYSPSQSVWLSSLAYPESIHHSFRSRPRRFSLPTLHELPEPQLLRLRPTSLRTQDISHLLTGVFRNLYTAEVFGDEVSTNLIKARGSEDEVHEEFVDELQQIRKLYKQRLDEFETLERHVIEACVRAIAEKQRAMNQAKVHDLEPFIKMPPVNTIFRWCVDNKLLQKHHLICPNDYYSDPVPFSPAPKGNREPGYLKLTFSCEKHATPKKELAKKPEAGCRKIRRKDEEESDYTMDSLSWVSHLKAKSRTTEPAKIASPPQNKSWMNHLRMPQRKLERLLLTRMENRTCFLRNPRFFPPNTQRGGKSLIFPPRKEGESHSGELSSADVPVFIANPPVIFFTDYEIGSVYEMVVSLQNTTSTSRYLRVIPPSTPYFSLGLGMFPGDGGMVAPGMICQYVVQFFPDCLGDFDDFIWVETQSAHPLLVPLQARRPPPVLTLSPVLDCGYCLVGDMKVSTFLCRNVGFSAAKFCVVPKKCWPPTSFRAIATLGLVEQPPFGIMPSAFELAPEQELLMEVWFLPTSFGKVEQTFIVICDNCQIREMVTSGMGQLVALELIYISGEKSKPDPGELTDLTAQHFIRFEPENLQSTARKQLLIRNATHVELAFHWQVRMPNLQALMPGEAHSPDRIKNHPDTDTAFAMTPEQGILSPYADHEFILSFSPHQLKDFHSVFQMAIEGVPELEGSRCSVLSTDLENASYILNDVIPLEIEVKGSVQPFQILLEPYALIIPGENYIGLNVKKDFKMWNNSKSRIRYTWGKICDCHIIEVEPCTGSIASSEVEDFELKFTGGAPGPTSQDLPCEIKDSPWPVVLHIEATFKGPTLDISVSALQFGLLRLGQKATKCIHIQNTSPLPAMWHMQEGAVCLEERREDVSPFHIEPSGGQVHPLGDCRVNITLEARQVQCLQTVLVLEVVNGPWSYLPVYAEVQEPHVYLQSSQVVVNNLFLGVPTKAGITLINGTLLPTRFHWGRLLGHQASFCKARVSPRRGTLRPGEELQLSLELTAHTQDELTDLALPCSVSGMKEPLVLGISGKPQGLQVNITIWTEDSKKSVSCTKPGHKEALRLDFGATVPLRTCVHRQLILTNCSPIQTSFTLKFEYFGSPQKPLSQKPSVPDVSPALLKTDRIRQQLAKREHLDFMENMLSHGKGASFFPHVSQGTLGARQQLQIDITACANMWGEYWDSLICQVGDLPPSVIPVHMVVVGCPISSQRTNYSTDPLQKEPVLRFSTQVSGGGTVTRVLRLNNSSPCDIRLDWETYAPEDREDQLLELLVFCGPPFPLRDQDGNEVLSPETPESSSSSQSPSIYNQSSSSVEAAHSAESSASASASAAPIISVVLQEHEGVPSDHLYRISPKQVVVPAGGSSSISISFTPMVLGPHVLHKVECTGYALGFMSLDSKVERELPGRRRRLQGFAVGPLRLDLQGFVRPAQLSVELDYGGGMRFRLQASDLIPVQPCDGVLSELVTTHHLKLTNTTDIPHYFRLQVSRPFSVSPDGASRTHRAAGAGWEQECEEGWAAAHRQLVLHPQENMLVDVSFTLSLELLCYQKLPADQMLPGVDIRQSASGEREMVFTQNLRLEYANQTTQVVPLQATVAVPELQLSTSWVDFGTCFVNQERVREIYLMNLSGCRSYWAMLMDQEPDQEPAAFKVFPSSGLLEARSVNAPPTSIILQVLFTARSSELYESTLVVEGMLGEKACTLRLRGRGSYDERFVPPYQP
uniref:DLEC1 cilia and flagella associated protein n=2 Tax=Pipistrellus kuhlii TaxID=59472 RepID=A0A7J7WCN4_PIPKU|nr:DLEC1 cilia and flagella associated protein [Pipistrellus kuhlii]